MFLHQIHPASCGRKTLHDGLSGSCIAEQVQVEVKCSQLHMSMVSLSGMCHMLSQVMTARCVTSLVLVSTNAFIYFREDEEEEQSLTHPERVVQKVSSSVTVLDGMMADVAHSH